MRVRNLLSRRVPTLRSIFATGAIFVLGVLPLQSTSADSFEDAHGKRAQNISSGERSADSFFLRSAQKKKNLKKKSSHLIDKSRNSKNSSQILMIQSKEKRAKLENKLGKKQARLETLVERLEEIGGVSPIPPSPSPSPSLSPFPGTSPRPSESPSPSTTPVLPPTPTPTEMPGPEIGGSTPGPITSLTPQCSELQDLSIGTARQVSIVEQNNSCASQFVSLFQQSPAVFLEAFYQLIPSSKGSSALFSAMYNPVRFNQFNFDPPILEDMYEKLPAAVDQCVGLYRCGSWRSYILDYFYRGRFHRCPDISSTNEVLREGLQYADYTCTESLAAEFTKRANTDIFDALLYDAEYSEKDYARRNSWRVLVRFGLAATDTQAYDLARNTRRIDVQSLLLRALETETFEDALHDVIYIIAAQHSPFHGARELLRGVIENTNFSESLLFRAVDAYSRIIYSTALQEQEILNAAHSFLTSLISHEYLWIRADAAYWMYYFFLLNRLSASEVEELDATLQARWELETELPVKIYLAKGLDEIHNSNYFEVLKQDYEAEYLGNEVEGYGIRIRSSLPIEQLQSYLEMMNNTRNAFFDLLGPNFSTPIPGDVNETVTLILLESPNVYEEYMNAFGPCCADAGGVYIEQTSTFYTYDRTPAQSIYTTEQLIKHEFGHYLTGRYIQPGVFGDSVYSAQPRLWQGEGWSEVLAALEFDEHGSYTLYPHNIHQKRICTYGMPDVSEMISAREYQGSQTYSQGWGLNYYLITEHHDEMLALLGAFRDQSYTVNTFANIIGYPSLSAFQLDFHERVQEWCSLSQDSLFAASHMHDEDSPTDKCSAQTDMPIMSEVPEISSPFDLEPKDAE